MKGEPLKKLKLSVETTESYKLILYPLLLAFVFVISWWNVGFNSAVLATMSFWTKVFFKYLLVFTWVFFGVPDGEKKSKAKAEFKTCANEHRGCTTLISDKGLNNAFADYVVTQYEIDRIDYLNDLLRQIAVDRLVYDLPLAEIMARQSELNIDKYQLAYIKKLKRGKFQLKKYDYKVYLTNQIVDVGYKPGVETNKAAFITSELLLKMVLLLITVILTTAVSLSERQSVGEASYSAISNLTLSLTSYAFAIKSGMKFIDTQAVPSINNKIRYIHRFIEKYENGKYVESLAVYEETEIKAD